MSVVVKIFFSCFENPFFGVQTISLSKQICFLLCSKETNLSPVYLNSLPRPGIIGKITDFYSNQYFLGDNLSKGYIFSYLDCPLIFVSVLWPQRSQKRDRSHASSSWRSQEYLMILLKYSDAWAKTEKCSIWNLSRVDNVKSFDDTAQNLLKMLN